MQYTSVTFFFFYAFVKIMLVCCSGGSRNFFFFTFSLVLEYYVTVGGLAAKSKYLVLCSAAWFIFWRRDRRKC